MQAHPQPEISWQKAELAFDSDDVRVDEQELTATARERVVLAENPRRDECQHRTGLCACDPPAQEPPRFVGAARHHAHRVRGESYPVRPVHDHRVRHLPAGLKPGDIPDRDLCTARRFSELGDDLVLGVVTRRWAGTGEPGARGGREVPVHHAPDREPAFLGRRHEPHPHDRSVAARASIAVRPVGPALLDISENVSTRPLTSVTMPARVLIAVSEPVLARSQPAASAV